MRSALEQFHEDASHADKSDFTALKKLEKKAEKLSLEFALAFDENCRMADEFVGRG